MSRRFHTNQKGAHFEDLPGFLFAISIRPLLCRKSGLALTQLIYEKQDMLDSDGTRTLQEAVPSMQCNFTRLEEQVEAPDNARMWRMLRCVSSFGESALSVMQVLAIKILAKSKRLGHICHWQLSSPCIH